MLSGLREAIENLDPAVDSAELTDLLVLRDVLEAKVSRALGEFDAAQLWELDDRVSLRDWLRVHGRMTTADALDLAQTVRRLRDVPTAAQAWVDGGLSSSQVGVVVDPLTNRRRPTFAEIEAAMVPPLCFVDTREIERVMAEWVERFDHDHPRPQPGEPENSLHVSRIIDDRGEVRGSFTAVNATVVDTALGVAESRDAEGECRLPSERRADALVDICRHFLDSHNRPERRRRPSHVHLVVTPEQLAYGRSGHTLDGQRIPDYGIATLCCDSVLHRFVSADGEIVDLGRATKVVSAKLFQKVAVRDRGCRYPGCDRPPKWCDAHHVEWWWHGGRTDLSNLVLLCRRHHTRIHKRGVHAKLLHDGTLKITLPNSQVLTSKPPKPGPLL